MFTGIIETIGEVTKLERVGSNVRLNVRSSISHELKIDQSLAHNGICLTVVGINGDEHVVVAIDETLKKTNLAKVLVGSKLNLERCMQMNGRIDGHLVQGHIDQTAICTTVKEENGSWVFSFEYDATTGNLTVEKGSVCLNGISLTVFNSGKNTFSVAVIPYTYEHTTMNEVKKGTIVNLEFDIIGKYVAKYAGTNN